jgi:hypothetical protein
VWSATTATAPSIRTTWRTPLTARAAASFADLTLPPKAGEMAIAANFIPDILASMPNCAFPLTLSAESKRLTGVPIRVKSFGCFSATLSGAGIGNAAAASTSSP